MQTWPTPFFDHLSYLDQPSVDDLERLYRQFGQEAEFENELITGLQTHPELQNALTWLLKHHLEQGAELSPETLNAWIRLAPDLREWPAKLHVLQSLPRDLLLPEHLEHLFPWLDQEIQSPNKFIRAWAYNGLAIAAKTVPELMPEVKERFLLALEEEAASVQARIRRAMVELKLDFL